VLTRFFSATDTSRPSLSGKSFGQVSGPPPWNDTTPIRSELFSVERLEEHARSLATEQLIVPGPTKGNPLSRRLAANEQVLLAAYHDIVTAIEENAAITPAAEWLVDNYHVIERQVREVRRDLPPGYYRQLPKLAVGPFAGYPRVFGLTWAFVAHTDSLFDPEILRRFLRAYQDVQPLTIGELWAVAITLRIVLLENLRRIAGRITDSRAARREADLIADRLLGVAGREAEPAGALLKTFGEGPFASAFLVQLAHRLRDQDPNIAPALTWLDGRLAAQATTAENVVRDEHRRQVSASVTVRNIITSMRLLSDVDWSELFERVSLVDDLLSAGDRFAEMDFPTRNLYRSAIEELARGARRTELEIAAAALQMAREDAVLDSDVEERRASPGYYLIADGRGKFETAIGFRAPLRAWPARFYRSLGIGGYVSAGTLVAAVILGAVLTALAMAGVGTAWLLALGVLGLVPAIDVSVALVNYVLTRAFRATLLPALDLRAGIPPHLRTLITVPMLLSSRAQVEEQIEQLEIHYLASPNGKLHFALLSDWKDADREQVEGDDELFSAATAGIAELNRRYGQEDGDMRFFLLHRKRVWNEGEGRWIGWERKRGKLMELNRLLRGATDTTFLGGEGHSLAVPTDIRYVITLDSDTRLPRTTVERLIGKMAHPLNWPRFDKTLGRVVEGYGVLQPRVTPALPGGHGGSLYLRVFTSAAGIDPYAAAVSDVYQDLFGEGSYTGKGIYDVDAFEASLSGRVPESTLLSHDLFEGVFARAGLASDAEVVEDFPDRYDTAAMRQHRWARGDWQLLPWILGKGPRVDGRRRGVSAIGRLKMLDNLRRSASAPTVVLALIAGLSLSLQPSIIWIAFILATLALPPMLPVFAGLAPRRSDVALRGHLSALGADLRLALLQTALIITFLAHQAWLMGDAVLRTLVRLTITRRHLLEWTPAAQAASSSRPGVWRTYREMAGALVVALAAVAAALSWGRGTWPLASAFAALWLLSPAVALWVSRSPAALPHRILNETDTTTLQLIARRTWRFFETFVTTADHMLPPDNFQETPEPKLAHRTSPTNIGLYLLSVGSARDFGWIGTLEAGERLEATMTTLAQLSRYRGHFYNWYDTQDLRPLDPQYVSSVDSGNLAGHLIALANTCNDWAHHALTETCRFDGIRDALELCRQEAELLGGARPAKSAITRQLNEDISALGTAIDAARANPGGGACVGTRLARFVGLADSLLDTVRALTMDEGNAGSDLRFWAEAVRASIESHSRDAAASSDASLTLRLRALAEAARAMALSMEFGFLINSDKLLLSIGYNTLEGRLDPSSYDLLASEARLASFIAIAKGDVPVRHWFRLSHAVVSLKSEAALISWSGSMFEYLMPSLVMRAPRGSLLEQTSRLIVGRQIEYGATLKVPWGISESAYNARDLEFTYQYSNFGVPGLGLKRGLADNEVVAPYATALAAMIDPGAAVLNFERLAAVGACGRYGFYEALDYTRARVPDNETFAVVRAFMAHHQGMTIVAIANALMKGLMRDRFHAEPIVRATELLLQERVPRDVVVDAPLVAKSPSVETTRQVETIGSWRTANPKGATPATQLLSNGRYTVMVTAAGSGYSAWRNLAVTRWREDSTCDDIGSYVYLRDTATGQVFSPALQPTGMEPDSSSVSFNEDNAEFTRRDGTLTTNLEILVSAEDDAEVRRVTLSNAGSRVREIEITSYAELVLAPQSADVAHPAFSKLFVETEHLAGLGALIASRRRRTPSDPNIWAAHLAVVEGEAVGPREFETDRTRFLGRGNTLRTASAVFNGRPLSGTAGIVLDPIFALRRRIRLAPGAAASIDFWTMAASSREEILDLLDKHHDTNAFPRAAALAWTQAQVQLHHLDVNHDEAGQFQRLASRLIYAGPSLRPPSDTIGSGRAGQPQLWPLGISGDLPILLVRVSEMEQLDVVRQALQAVEYSRMKGLAVDLVILNERSSSYVQDLQIALETIVRANQSRPRIGEDMPAGHIFMLRADLIPAEAHALLLSTARAVLVGERGRLSEQLQRVPEIATPMRPISTRAAAISKLNVVHRPPDVEYFNGLGGFVDDGREYVVILGPGQTTPAPWINVIANPGFGFHVSAEGGGYAWSQNSRERQLTPWSNDPVTDRPGQAIYLMDEETGELWTPTALPIRVEAATYVARHGWGYSRFEHTSHDLEVELIEYVPLADPIKISRLKLRNSSNRTRRFSVTAYVEWALGPSRGAAAPFVTTRIDPDSRAMFAQNAWYPAFAERVAFADLGGRQASWTGDRREFIGRNGSLASPAALAATKPLSGRVGSGRDPCGALQATITLAPGAADEIVLFLGDGSDDDHARALIDTYRTADLDAVLSEVHAQWQDIAGAIQVKTPDRSMDIMLNGWLLYQTLVCRIWARSGFYQVSGAYGFRDQLQDGMALATVRPDLTREHLVRAAGRQFAEGDVQHWWLPHSGQGVRTRISDDRAWLAYTTAHYVGVTGDAGVLDEAIPFLEGAVLKADETDNFFQPTASNEIVSLYEHCARALDASLAVGRHGVPLIGTGDWNDGMNRVGEGGEGESVWLGWMLHATLKSFLPLAEARKDTDRVATWRAYADTLQASLDRQAWDGDWYLRAWFDDGTPLGSTVNDECRIDSIAQSWAVLSGAAAPERARRGMAAVDRELILSDEKLALLFAPPFDRTPLDPGYIKGYPPGVRENGGQYTHAALWSVMAFAALGEGGKAAALFYMLNPINHARTRADTYRYKVEPYVVAADVYASRQHLGRGGWTWYTGSAGWMQRAGIESILGLRIEDGVLHFNPCIPNAWPRFEATVRYRSARYEIRVENPSGVMRGVAEADLDGVPVGSRPLKLSLDDDGAVHRLTVRLG
jgi:cyclic beta-1,2-glucan synthetase